jgi:hypothetical protein
MIDVDESGIETSKTPCNQLVHFSGPGGGVRPSTYEEFDMMN